MTTNFKERFKAETKVQVLTTLVPHIEIHPDAITKMQIYVENVAKEVGWLGTAYRTDKNTILIRDVFLFDQEVHATTTEITPEGLTDFATELLLQPDGIDIWNNIKMWGHSHVNMAVGPSGQDDKQMETFAQGGHDWFIRLIANKQGDMKLDLYNYQHGIIFTDLPWSEGVDAEALHIKAQISELHRQLNQRKTDLKSSIEEPIKLEIKEKVREKTFATAYGAGQGYAGYRGYPAVQPIQLQSASEIRGFQPDTKGGTKTTSISTTTTTGGTEHQKKNATGSRELGFNLYDLEPDDIISSEEDLAAYFKVQDLLSFGQALTILDVNDELIELGYENYFSDSDVFKIYNFSKQYCHQFGLI